ncbi:SdrD B-like domain-containing protein [Spirosoma foliorum]|uniref:DUF11 domain-containing protein n=1 Tax=Spirosoma foliorum TaxID=2710596 RepID=A0A7G5H021_9BACT|nr:SdrD B-like domain-containing protein [Spirosoma foliorum]QMW04463.1 DUF11 domain-containing protein [Spirosoma foliorum]
MLEAALTVNNGTIPNGTVVNTTAELTSTGGFTSGVKSHSITVTAAPYICTKKVLVSGGALDNVTTYAIRVTGNDLSYGYVPNGYLTATNITLTDNLPAGAQFVSAQLINASSGNPVSTTITQSGGVVTAVIPDLNPAPYWTTNIYELQIKVKYNSSAGFTSGQTVTNTSTLTFTPFGGSPITVTDGSQVSPDACVNDLSESTVLSVPTANASLTKSPVYGLGPSVYPGQTIAYCIGFTNTGNVDLNNVELIESIPSNLRYAGRNFYNEANAIDHFEYQTNLNSNWTPTSLTSTAPGPNPNNSAEYYTKIKIVLVSPFPANSSLAGTNGNAPCPSFSFLPATEVTTDTPIQNCVSWTSTTPGIPASRTACDGSLTLKPRPTQAIVGVRTDHAPACSGPYLAGQALTNTLTVSTDLGGADLSNPVLMLFPSPAGYFEYVPNSASFIAGTSSLTVTPTFEYIPNYAGTGRFLLRWTFPAGTKLPYGTSMSVSAQMKLTSAGTSGHQLQGYVSGDNIGSFSHTNGGPPTSVTDQYDLNGNSSTTDILGTQESSYNSCAITVSSSASMESIKWVKGQLDTDYSRYPASGNTVPGGKADYRLVVRNTGNVPMKDIEVLDILPFVGDHGVIDLSARNTAWRPNLADAIAAPAGVTVYYSISSNPCRDELKSSSDPSPFPTGCTPANWSTTLPSDITKVQSIKLDLGSIIIQPGDSLEFTWPMRAPVDAPTNGEIAWNSFGFVATRTDNNTPLLGAEPIKVGIKVNAGQPGFYGDYVWFDSNHDGVQDAGEQGIDGIKVKLFNPTTNTANPATDPLWAFTITGNGGKYLFSNLPPGNYYAVFELPAGYSISPKGGTANPALDSDGSPITYDGGPATIVSVTDITAGETDLSWDQGIYCTLAASASATLTTVPVGGTISLSASGGTSYLWSGPNGFNSTLQNPTIPNATTANAGIYSVLVTSGRCSVPATVTITIGNPCSLSATVTLSVCSTATNQYSISGTIKLANNATGGTATITDGAKSTTVTIAASATSVAYSLTGLTSGTGSHTVTVSLSGCGTTSLTYSAPASCTVAPACGLAMIVTPGLCQSATNSYVLSGTITATNVPTSGTLTITSGAFTPRSLTLPATANVSGTFSYSGLVSNGQAYTITASYSNSACSPASQTFTAPASCSVAPVCSLSATATTGVCATATNTYSATVAVPLTNATAGTLTVSIPGSTPISQTIAAGTPSFTAVFAGLVSDGASHTATVSLPGCGTTAATFAAPASCSITPVCSISAVATAGLCQTATNTYSSTVVVTVKNPTSGTLSVTDGAQTLTFSTTANSQNTFTAEFNGLISNGTSHSVTATLPGCSTTTTTYSAPASCSVTPACNLSLTAGASACNPATNLYVLSGTITVTNSPSSQTLTLTDGSYVRSLTAAAGTTTISYSYTTLQSDGAKHTVTVVSSGTACGTASATYTAPASCSVAPVCSVSATATAGLCATATNTYSNTVLVTMTNPTAGTLTVSHGVNSLTFAVPATVGTVTTSAIFNGLVSDGASHTVTASLPGCSTTTTVYTAPGSCTQPAGTQLSLNKLVDKSKAKVGDVLTYTIVLTNSGTTTATNVVVRDSSTTGLAYVANSATAPSGTTFTQGTPISTWKVAPISAGQSLSLTFQAIADSSGIMYNVATIPGDTATVCTSVPFVMCAGDSYLLRLTAAPGRSAYKWFKDNVEITGQTTNVLDVTAPGTYSLAVDNVSGKCPDFSCCPFIVEEDTLPTFKATATPVTCIGGTAQTNGKIVLSQFRTGYTYQYSSGSSFNAAASLSGNKQVIPTNGLIVNNLANPTVATAYTVRVYNSSGCYTDATVMLLPTVCNCPTDACVPLVIKQTKGIKRR